MFLELQKSLLVSFQGCWTQWQRFESSSICHFWDTLQHFLKTHFCWESGFLFFLELQKSLLVSRAIENRCLEYRYTKLGRWTFFGWWPPQDQSRDDLHTTTQNLVDEPTLANGPPWYQSRDDLHTTTQNLADEPTLANGPSGNRAEMTCIPLQKSWQMNLLWPMDPPVPEQRWLAYHHTKLGRWTYFGQWTPLVIGQRWLAYHYKNLGRWTYFGQWTPLVIGQRWLAYHYKNLGRWTYFGQWTPAVPDQRWLAYHYTKLGRWTYFGQWIPQYQSRDDLHTTIQNLADEPTLADVPPITRAEMTCIPLYKTWQMNLLWLMYPPVPEQRCIAYHYTKLGRWTYFGWCNPQYQRRDDLHTTTQNLADGPTLANGPPSNRAEMTCIPPHKTWQMNLLWPMDPTDTRAEMTCIPLHKTWQMNLLWPMDPHSTKAEMIAYHYTKLGRWTYFGSTQ